MASGGGSSQSAKPVFAKGQKDAASSVLERILIPGVFGGVPDPGFELGVNRARSAYLNQAADRGVDPRSGAFLKGAADVEKGGLEALARQRFDLINRIVAPMGQQSSGSSTQVGFGS